MRQISILLHIRFRPHELDVAACGVGIRTQLVRRDDKQEFIGFHADIEEQQRTGIEFTAGRIDSRVPAQIRVATRT
jgi:hypothetical protein